MMIFYASTLNYIFIGNQRNALFTLIRCEAISGRHITDYGQTDIMIHGFFLDISVKEAAKKIKILFLVARPLRPCPPPLELSGHIFWEGGFFRASKKSYFS